MTKLALLNANGDAVKTPTVLRMEPLGDNMLVRKVESSREGSKILLPHNMESTLMEGVVLKAGPGRLRYDAKTQEDRIALGVKAGDRVVFSRRAALEVDPFDQDVLLVGEEVILLVERA